jgi:hypothetical protein
MPFGFGDSSRCTWGQTLAIEASATGYWRPMNRPELGLPPVRIVVEDRTGWLPVTGCC